MNARAFELCNRTKRRNGSSHVHGVYLGNAKRSGCTPKKGLGPYSAGLYGKESVVIAFSLRPRPVNGRNWSFRASNALPLNSCFLAWRFLGHPVSSKALRILHHENPDTQQKHSYEQ